MDALILLGREGHGVAEHGEQEGLGGVGADDLAPEAGFDQVRHAADVVDMGVGQEQVVEFFGRYGKPGKRQFRITALGFTAIHQDVDVVRLAGSGFDEMAGAGHTVFCAEMGYPDRRFYRHPLNPMNFFMSILLALFAPKVPLFH